jgi:hypothetical protein
MPDSAMPAAATAPDVVLELVERFSRNRDNYRQPGYKEAQLRQEFIDPLFEALGWDMSNQQGYAEAYKDVIHEDSLKIGGETKAPDYCMRVGGTRKFFVEAKKPSVNIKQDTDAAFQLKRYAWSAKLPLSILTNFELIAVYDCTRKPEQLEHPANSRLMLLPYTELPERWQEIGALFSREGILKGLFDTYASSAKAKRGTAEVDASFLAEIDKWRADLARNINLRNPALGASLLNWSVQQIIDRVVFLRICEDRGIEPYGQLREAVAGKTAYALLGQRFRQADDKFNSGLFHFRDEAGREPADNITLGLNVDDGVLRDIVRALYYPASPYEFSVLAPDILGQVYEQFLGKSIVIEGGRARVELRPEVAKAGGVYYTPTHIVDRINAATLGPLLAKTTVTSLHSGTSKLRLVDPACGSGSFLLDAYQKLLDWYLARYAEEPRRWLKGAVATIREDGRGGVRLTTAERKRILVAHVFGVDIDPQAVEVTKLSLLLKVLEGETQESLALQLSLFHERALPDLGANIKCGNSLVGADFSSGIGTGLSTRENADLNAFDWSAEFPAAAGNGGFDAVVTNPPWLMAGYYVKPALSYFADRYATATGKYDLYYLFIERAIALAASAGRIGMIVPNKLFHTRAASRLRAMLAGAKRLEEIVDFGDAQVFARATNYSCLLIMGEELPNRRPPTYSRVGAWLTVAEVYDLTAEALDATTWTFANTATRAFFERVREMGTPLSELTEHFGNGVQSGADRVYLVDDSGVANLKLERSLIRPFLRGRDVRRFAIGQAASSIVFPYEELDGRYVAVEDDILRAAPNVAAYLEKHRAALDRRVWFGKSATELSGKWYGLMYVDRPTAFKGPHLLTPSLTNRGNFAIDSGSLFATGTAGVVSVVLRADLPESIEYVLALLNSALLTRFAVAHSPIFQGGYFKFSRRYIDGLPIRRIDPTNASDIAAHDALRELVLERLALEADGATPATPQAQVARLRRMGEVEAEIDRLVFSLYDVSAAEAGIIAKAERQRLAHVPRGGRAT